MRIEFQGGPLDGDRITTPGEPQHTWMVRRPCDEKFRPVYAVYVARKLGRSWVYVMQGYTTNGDIRP